MNFVASNAPSGVGSIASKIQLEQRLKEAIYQKETTEVSARLAFASFICLCICDCVLGSKLLISHAFFLSRSCNDTSQTNIKKQQSELDQLIGGAISTTKQLNNSKKNHNSTVRMGDSTIEGIDEEIA
jgi:hypothetical protein